MKHVTLLLCVLALAARAAGQATQPTSQPVSQSPSIIRMAAEMQALRNQIARLQAENEKLKEELGKPSDDPASKNAVAVRALRPFSSIPNMFDEIPRSYFPVGNHWDTLHSSQVSQWLEQNAYGREITVGVEFFEAQSDKNGIRASVMHYFYRRGALDYGMDIRTSFSQKNAGRLQFLQRGQKITIIGKISKISFVPTAGGSVHPDVNVEIWLEDCAVK
jgi:hypothetical protein